VGAVQSSATFCWGFGQLACPLAARPGRHGDQATPPYESSTNYKVVTEMQGPATPRHVGGRFSCWTWMFFLTSRG
jgi:hypothetical protein